MKARLKQAGIGVHVLIAAAGKIEDYQIGGFELGKTRDESGEGMRGFESRDDAFGDGEKFRGFERVLIGSKRLLSKRAESAVWSNSEFGAALNGGDLTMATVRKF